MARGQGRSNVAATASAERDLSSSGGKFVERLRLVEALVANRVGLVEAGAGYGKSVLAWQYRRHLGVATALVPIGPPDDDAAIFTASLRRALLAGRLSDLASATNVDDPVGALDGLLDALVGLESPLLVILDDAHHLSGTEVSTLVLRLARGLPAPHRLLVTARRLGPGLEPLRALGGTAFLDTEALSFTAAEASDLVCSYLGRPAPERQLSLLLEATRGWATALVLAATSGTISEGGDVGAGGAGGDVIAPLLRTITDVMQPAERAGAVQLAHVPLLSGEVADAVTGIDGLLDRMVAAGIPLARTASGWWEMPGPVTSHLASRAPLVSATAQSAARVYEGHGELLAAFRLLLEAGLHSDAAGLLAGISPERVDDIGWATLRDFVDELQMSAVETHPRVLLHLARVAETAHRADLRTAALERVADILARQGNDGDRVLRREVDAERARDLVWDERTRGEAKALATSVIDTAGEKETTARARALDVLGRLASWFSAEGPQPEAEALLEESARLARRIGQRTWEAQALVALAMGFFFALCRYERALATLDEVLAQLPARSRYRALVQSFRSDVLVELGRFAEAEASIDDMREIGRAVREEWVLAYAGWSEAALASYSGDRPRTVRAVADVESHRDVWYEQASGVEFLVCAADNLDRTGEHELASEYLARAEARMAGVERPVRVFGAAILGRSGDPVEAGDIIEAALAGGDLEPQERWPLLLMRANAARRRGDPLAGALAAEAFDACRDLGHPQGPLVRERDVAEALLPLAVEAGSAAATALLSGAGRLAVGLLGGFELRRGGRGVELPPGRPAKAVRAVAAAGGRLHAEELLEILWPEADLEAGRNRLRNLLSRLRVAAGDVLVRDQEVVMLAPGFGLDAALFESQARSALAAAAGGDTTSGVGLARSALALYRGDLLPDDRYEAWAAGPRERLKTRFVELLDLLADDAERRDEVDEAVRFLRRATEAEPYDESRYVHVAELLVSQGRTGSARVVLGRARAALDELGLDPSPHLASLEAEIGMEREG
jgi:ATP/maltotriose-dependent transcriptional regulator MalT/DNA-binding SARP family transcriptional activator